MLLCVMVLCTALLLNEIYLHMKFQASSLNTYWVMLLTKFKNENKQRAITPKVWCLELWFLCTALLNEIYLPVDALHSFKIMLRTKTGRTEGLMSRLLYANLREHKNWFTIKLFKKSNLSFTSHLIHIRQYPYFSIYT